MIVFTNRLLCEEDFLVRVERLAIAGVEKIILREKDLELEKYEKLAFECKKLCERYSQCFYIHSNVELGQRIGINKIHLPLFMLEEKFHSGELVYYKEIGVSIHSLEEAKKAEKLGATYLIAGHIFNTDCKKGIEPRGVQFLSEICDLVNIPVYGVGGIDKYNYKEVKSAGAKGICVMSSAMKCKDVDKFVKELS